MTKVNIKSYLKLLGISKLKPKQKEIINLILKKKDIIGILPTGYGKSLCYILPFMIKNKNVIVISPLISLMKDQHDKLKSKNIETIVFNSTFSRLRDTKEGRQKLDDIYNKRKKFLMYFSPESFIRNQFLFEELIKLNLISLVAIDECHCVNSWSEFRSDYKNLNIIKKLREQLKSKFSLLSLTATATIQTQKKIKQILELDNPELVKVSSYKSNLELFVREKSNEYIDEIYTLIMSNGKKNKCIIYCKTKADTEHISSKLKDLGLSSDFYHAGLPSESRDKIQNDFKSNKINVIAATIAFGMGIDIPDIHLIIHYGISKNIESYYQEVGRGGRDGKQVKCYVFWSSKDLWTNRYFIKQIENEEFRKQENIKVNHLDKYIHTRQCRMKYICKYFGDNLLTKKKLDECGKCDNCLLKQERLDNMKFVYTEDKKKNYIHYLFN